jgi:hypothetical protein
MEIMKGRVGRWAMCCDAVSVTSYQPPPADGLRALWADTDGVLTEDTTLRWENEAWTVENTLLHHRTQAVMRVSAGWQVRQVLVFRDLPEPDLWLANDGAGRWGEVNGAHRQDLDGCTDAVVADSVTGYLPALRRLPLHIGHSAEVRVAMIEPDTLSVLPVTWRIHRLGDISWQVETSHHGRDTSFDVDRFGLPLHIDGRCRRINADDS